MSEFPSKVSTQTSSNEAPSAPRSGVLGFLRPDVDFLRTIPALLMVVEMVLGLLVWALIADSQYHSSSAYNWVMFVALFCWLVTLILFVIYLLQLQRKMTFIPWSILLFAYHCLATALYITGFITCAASVQPTSATTTIYNKRAAASFFACLVMIAYGASATFSFLAWRGIGSNAATAQA